MYVLSIDIRTEKEYRKEGTEAYNIYGLEHGTPTRIETRASTTKNVNILRSMPCSYALIMKGG
jgi:hypothetical protein